MCIEVLWTSTAPYLTSTAVYLALTYMRTWVVHVHMHTPSKAWYAHDACGPHTCTHTCASPMCAHMYPSRAWIPLAPQGLLWTTWPFGPFLCVQHSKPFGLVLWHDQQKKSKRSLDWVSLRCKLRLLLTLTLLGPLVPTFFFLCLFSFFFHKSSFA